MISARHIYAFILIAILSLGCGESKEPGYEAGIEHVILVVVDTLRSNHCGFMGYERPTSPFLDEFSRRCVVFDNAYCTRALTLPSFASIFSGLHTINTGVFQNAWPLHDDTHLLIEDFQSSGFTTLGFPASGILDDSYGIARGFDLYDKPVNPPRMAADEIRAVKKKINTSSGPLFAFIHFWEPHSPYDPDTIALSLFAEPGYDGPMDGSVEILNSYNLFEINLDDSDIRHAIDRYDGEIRWLDDHLADLFGYFETKGLIDNSLIVITADHGESLGEGHFFQHNRDTEVELHVPLMFHFPGDRSAGRRIPVLVENTDILPTVMDILGIPIPDGIDGMSLLPLIDGTSTQHRERLLSVGPKQGDMYLYSEFDGRTRRRVDIGINPSTVDLDKAMIEELKSLGYIN